jgi:hypothetical protein
MNYIAGQPTGPVWRLIVSVQEKLAGLADASARLTRYPDMRARLAANGVTNAPVNPFSSAYSYFGKPTRVSSEEVPNQSSPEPFADMWRPDDSRFSVHDRQIIAAARSYLEKERQKPVDGYYKIDHTKEGHEVFVMFAAGYEHGRPLFYPGGHCTVLLRKDGSVIRVLPGD